MNKSKMIHKVRTQEHANGKSVPILRDYSMQVKIVQAAIRRKRKNDVRNTKVTNDLLINSVDSNVAQPVSAGEGGSEGLSPTFDRLEDRTIERFPGAVTRRVSAATPPTFKRSYSDFGLPGVRVEGQDGGAGLRESDGVGRVEEPALRGDGGDSSLSDQPS